MRLLAILCILAGTSAQAQRASEEETGSHILIPKPARISNDSGVPEAVRGRVLMAEFARCIVDREYAGVARTIVLPAGEFERQVGRLATPECLDSGMVRFGPMTIRGPLFRELYVRRDAAAARGRTWGPVAPKIDISAPDASEAGRTAALAFGSCVVRRNEQGARKVVLSATGSAAQDEAVKAIVPDLGPCIQQGSQLRMSKTFIEAVLAEVLYRGVDVPTTTAAAVVEAK